MVSELLFFLFPYVNCDITMVARSFVGSNYYNLNSYKLNIFIPPANFVCGGVYCFHVVRVCVRASVRVSVRNVLFP